MNNDIQARLTVQNIKGMDKRKIKALVKWLRKLTDELEKEDVNIYAKNPRWTLYK